MGRSSKNFKLWRPMQWRIFIRHKSCRVRGCPGRGRENVIKQNIMCVTHRSQRLHWSTVQKKWGWWRAELTIDRVEQNLHLWVHYKSTWMIVNHAPLFPWQTSLLLGTIALLVGQKELHELRCWLVWKAPPSVRKLSVVLISLFNVTSAIPTPQGEH